MESKVSVCHTGSAKRVHSKSECGVIDPDGAFFRSRTRVLLLKK